MRTGPIVGLRLATVVMRQPAFLASGFDVGAYGVFTKARSKSVSVTIPTS